ncbi:MAG TPA: hypothetical protein VFS45_05430, partial [Sphingomicrobium sp.]|nr:hypothetical protein [Sphingomicrobium sp.]
LAGLAALAAIVALGWSRSLPLRIMAEDRNVVRLGLGIAWLSAFAYQGLTGSCEDSRHLWVLFGLLIAANRIETGGTRHEMHPANSLANRSPGENPQ